MNLRSRVSIFDIFTTRTTINTAQLAELVNFIVFNRGYKLDPVAVKAMLTVKPLTTTPIGALFTRALDLHKDNLFSFVRIPSAVVATPEVVTYSHVTFDLKQINTSSDQNLYAMVKALPDFADTIFCNVTALLRRTGEPIDALNMQSVIIRDLLSRSYYDNRSTAWLTPSLLRYLCRFYNMSMSSAVGTVYNLTYYEQQTVAIVFALFFLQRVSDTQTAEAMIKTTNLGLGSAMQINDVITRLKDVLTTKYDALSLDDVCIGINQLGIGRLANINRKFLYTRMRSIGPDVFTSAMALEYPPYWCYLVLATLSGRKMGLTNTLKRNDIAKDAPVFADDLLKSQSFLPSL